MLNISVEPYRRRAGTRVVLRLLVALALGHTTAVLVGVEQPVGEGGGERKTLRYERNVTGREANVKRYVTL